MAPAQHIEWLEDNTRWFLNLPEGALAAAVPACPGWTVENVLTHLAFGLGLGYPHALRVAPDCPLTKAFAELVVPPDVPVGVEVFTTFQTTMIGCIDAFKESSPDHPCFTYEGPGVAAFWFRRAAIETTLHRMDVEEALGIEQALAADRAIEAVAETVEFALPIAARWTASEAPAVTIQLEGTGQSFQIGSGDARASITGSPTAVLTALWGRSDDGIRLHGNAEVAGHWMTLVERAFAGR